ncbi:Metallo-dependent phosphatase-like protein, partial [Staphylotrichum tortipilum]
TIFCISDTHNTTPSPLLAGDILLHAGDLTQYGTFPELQSQLTWLAAQPHPHKLVVVGNHDLILDASFAAVHLDRELDCRPGRRRAGLAWGGVRYLEHEAVEVRVGRGGRVVRVFGSPWTPMFGSWGFKYGEGDGEEVWMGRVPDGTEVSLVHGPPKGYLDDGIKGCEALLEEVWRVRPRVVVCGHIHPGRGWQWLRFDQAQEWYERVVLGRQPWVSMVALAWCPWEGGGTLLINASMMGGRGNSERRDAFVVVL